MLTPTYRCVLHTASSVVCYSSAHLRVVGVCVHMCMFSSNHVEKPDTYVGPIAVIDSPPARLVMCRVIDIVEGCQTAHCVSAFSH